MDADHQQGSPNPRRDAGTKIEFAALLFGTSRRRKYQDALTLWGMAMRYIAIRDPNDEWLVYDRATDLPADANDISLIGLSQAEAERLADGANAQLLVLRKLSAVSRGFVPQPVAVPQI